MLIYSIKTKSDQVRLERFLRKTQVDLLKFNVHPVEAPNMKHDYKLLMDPDSTWIDFSHLDFSPIKYSKLFKSFIQKKINKKVVLSLSGGVDSMVVLAILVKANIPVVSVHIDFAHRLETPKEAAFVFDYCNHLGIPCYYRRIDEYSRGKHDKISRVEYESKSKNARLTFIQKVMKQTNSFAAVLGHHCDDTSENVITNIMKGRGILDLGVFQEFKSTHGVILWRPFLDFPKLAFIDLAHQCKIPYFKNTTPVGCNRRHFRDELIPNLEKQYGSGVPQLGFKKLSHSSAHWNKMIQVHLIQPLMEKVKYTTMGIWIPFKESFELVFWKEIIQLVFHRQGYKSPSQAAIKNLVDLPINRVCPLNKNTFGLRCPHAWVILKPHQLKINYQKVEQIQSNPSTDVIESLCLVQRFYFVAKYINKRKKFQKPFSKYPFVLRKMFPQELDLQRGKSYMLNFTN